MDLLVGVTVGREADRLLRGFCGWDHQRGYGQRRLGVKGGHFARLRLSGQQLAIHLHKSGQGAVRGSLSWVSCRRSFGGSTLTCSTQVEKGSGLGAVVQHFSPVVGGPFLAHA